jgi:hypothetical protein
MLTRSHLQSLLIAFLIWHMFAVCVYLLPANAQNQSIRQWTAPYILLFSQWQKWDIFSPNPVRRMSDYRIDRQTFSGWETVKEMTFDSLPWTTRAKQLKMLGRMEETWEELIPMYLLVECDGYPEATLRLVVKNTTLPNELSALLTISKNELPVTERVLGTASCPGAS